MLGNLVPTKNTPAKSGMPAPFQVIEALFDEDMGGCTLPSLWLVAGSFPLIAKTTFCISRTLP